MEEKATKNYQEPEAETDAESSQWREQYCLLKIATGGSQWRISEKFTQHFRKKKKKDANVSVQPRRHSHRSQQHLVP